jgi:lipoprotein-releasing system permease protein
VVAFVICWVCDTYKLIHLSGDVYFLDYLPFQMHWLDFVAVCSASMVISLLATLYPAISAARLDPVVAIRDSA